MTSIGIPVYLHYCGGELEEISYLTKANNCCGEEEEETEDDGCCKNESHVLLNAADFTFNSLSTELPSKSCTELFYLSLSSIQVQTEQKNNILNPLIESPPPRLQNDLMLSATFLRI